MQKDRKKLIHHIEKYWGGIQCYLRNSDPKKARVDIQIIMPGEDRPYLTLVTTGMSDQPMNAPDSVGPERYAELVMSIPQGWEFGPGAFSDSKIYWPYRCLLNIAKYVHTDSQWVRYLHTYREDENEPFADDVGFSACLLSVPILCSPDACQLEVNRKKHVSFLAVVPIYKTELQYAMKDGALNLQRKLWDTGITELVDKNRPAVA